MDSSTIIQAQTGIQITVEEVNRLLEVGRLLFSVLTTDGIEALQQENIMCSANKDLGTASVS